MLVVSDRGVVQAGHTQRGLDALQRRACRRELFDQVHENPSTDDVAAGVAAARAFAPDLLVGLGGGSSMDCAKGINFLYTNGGQMQDYWGVGKAPRADAADDRRAHDGRAPAAKSQSFALISDAADAREDGLRGQEGGVPRGDPRSRDSH